MRGEASARGNRNKTADKRFSLFISLHFFPELHLESFYSRHYQTVYIFHCAAECTQALLFLSLWQHYFLLQAAHFLISSSLKSFIRFLNKNYAASFPISVCKSQFSNKAPPLPQIRKRDNFDLSAHFVIHSVPSFSPFNSTRVLLSVQPPFQASPCRSLTQTQFSADGHQEAQLGG